MEIYIYRAFLAHLSQHHQIHKFQFICLSQKFQIKVICKKHVESSMIFPEEEEVNLFDHVQANCSSLVIETQDFHFLRVFFLLLSCVDT